MSSFANRHQKTIKNPFEAGETFTIQKLSGTSVELAQSEHIRKFINGQSPRGWESTFRRAMAAGTATEADVVKAMTDPLLGFDRTTVVQLGLVGWSYVDEKDSAKTPKPLTAAAIAELDDETMEHVALAIMRLTKPERFQTPEESEQARKNG